MVRQTSMMMSNKRGWIRIVEAFIAVLLITSVLLVVINKGYIGRTDISEQVYQVQLAVLREIELDSELRTAVLTTKLGEAFIPDSVIARIDKRMPDYLNCTAKICELDQVCSLDRYPLDKDIYAQPVAITAEGNVYEPRQLKLFCWTAA